MIAIFRKILNKAGKRLANLEIEIKFYCAYLESAKYLCTTYGGRLERSVALQKLLPLL